MKPFSDYSTEELQSLKTVLEEKYAAFQKKNLNLNMARGKPSQEQLDLSADLLSITDFKAEDGTDCRNYGVLEGLPECRRLFAELLDVEPKNVLIGGNASLTLMFDYISQCMTHGAGDRPWCKLDKVKFLCPVPGYDRHFTICEYFGIQMINIPMLASGPDMSLVRELVKDSSVKGMFCVPKYSNPQGITYADSVVRELASMETGAEDFRIIWDNAYCVHDLYDETEPLLNLLKECEKAGHPDRAILVASTSKITFSGAGVSALAASEQNIAAIRKRMNAQTISHDKLNQLRHVKFFKNAQGIYDHMKKHAAILRPKFEMVLRYFEQELGGKGIAHWFQPKGGYFISLDVMPGCATRVGQLCKKAGVTLTSIGATFPYGNDPEDQNIRIAPSYPPVEELEAAAQLLCLCVQIACVEQLLNK